MNYDAKLAKYLVAHGLVDDIAIVDVGCSRGIDPALRQLEPKLKGIGIDPLVPEIERLQRVETNPRLSYRAAYVVSDRTYPSGERHSTNWYARSTSWATLKK